MNGVDEANTTQYFTYFQGIVKSPLSTTLSKLGMLPLRLTKWKNVFNRKYCISVNSNVR